MKKYLLITLLSFVSIIAYGQKMEANGYVVTIANVESSSESATMFGKKTDYKEYKGNYTIQKDGKTILKNTFSAMKMENGLSLNIQIAKGLGNSLYYDFETKTYEWKGDEIKPKSAKNMENLILSGILIYAQSDHE